MESDNGIQLNVEWNSGIWNRTMEYSEIQWNGTVEYGIGQWNTVECGMEQWNMESDNGIRKVQTGMNAVVFGAIIPIYYFGVIKGKKFVSSHTK